MCWCDPNVRTPWCGRGSCVQPRPLPAFVPRLESTTDTIDLLVRQALGLLEEAHRLALHTAVGHNLDLLTQAQEGCAAWLREAT